jgi:hypothetical protein
MDLRSSPVSQFQVTRQEIGMKVRQNDVPDVKSEVGGILQILIHIPLGIHHSGSLCLFVSNQVRGVCQATEVVLF